MHSSSSLSVNEVLLIFGALNVFVLLSVLKAAYPPLKRKAHVKRPRPAENKREKQSYEWGAT